MNGCPQRIGICTKIMTAKPKKPNSAIRKLVKIRLSSGHSIRAVIPGSGYELMEFATLWFHAHRARDIPGIHYRCIRGKGDLEPPSGFIRMNRRSKFSIKNHLFILYGRHNYETPIFIGCRLQSARHAVEHEHHFELTWNKNKFYPSRAVRKRKIA